VDGKPVGAWKTSFLGVVCALGVVVCPQLKIEGDCVLDGTATEKGKGLFSVPLEAAAALKLMG